MDNFLLYEIVKNLYYKIKNYCIGLSGNDQEYFNFTKDEK